MGGDLDALPDLACEDVVSPVVLVVEVFRTDHRTHVRVVVVLSQPLSIVRLVVVQIQQVVRCPSLVFLSCVEVVSLDCDDFSIALLVTLHVFKAADLAGVPLFAQVGPLVLDMLVLLLAHSLISHSEILIESLLLYNQDRLISIGSRSVGTYLIRSG